MQNFRMDKYYQSYISSKSSKTVSLKFKPWFIVAIGLLLTVATILMMNIMDADNTLSKSTTSYVIPMHAQENALNVDNTVIDNANDTANNASVTPTWQDIPVSSGDTFVSLLSDLNVNAQDVSTLLTLPVIKKQLRHLQVGENLQILLDNNNHLLGLHYPISATQILTVDATDDSFVTHISTLKTQIQDKYAGTVIGNSLYTSANHVGLSHKTVSQLINIFSSQINFAKDIKPGDSFQIVYQDKFNEQHHLGAGDILAARLHVKGHEYTAIGYRDNQGNLQYYTPNGKSLKGGFLKSPVHYSHIASPFNLNRYHPILHFNRPHEGVDLAAPRGTLVSAAGNGRVTFVGRGGGYGNLITIDHGNGVTTRYAHLSGFMKGIHIGSYVHVGDKIGYVGSTGLATGPHLHYEIRIHNMPKNPLTIALANVGTELGSKEKRRFLAQATPLLSELNHKSTLEQTETANG